MTNLFQLPALSLPTPALPGGAVTGDQAVCKTPSGKGLQAVPPKQGLEKPLARWAIVTTGYWASAYWNPLYGKVLSVSESLPSRLHEQLYYLADPVGAALPWVGGFWLAAGAAAVAGMGYSWFKNRTHTPPLPIDPPSPIEQQPVSPSKHESLWGSWFKSHVPSLAPQPSSPPAVPQNLAVAVPGLAQGSQPKSGQALVEKEPPVAVQPLPVPSPDQEPAPAQAKAPAPLPELQQAATPAAPAVVLPMLQYEMLEELGSGSWGVVYKIRHKSSGEIRVLKLGKQSVMEKPWHRSRFRKEALAYQSIQSRHVVRLISFMDEPEAEPYMILQYMPGGTLEQWVEKHHNDPDYLERLVTIMMDCTLGLNDIYQAGMVHRDVKPQNIFLTDDEHGVVGDLGLVKDDLDKAASQILGTPGFMSPEQVTLGLLDLRSDLHGLGDTFFWALTGGTEAWKSVHERYRGGNQLQLATSLLGYPPQNPRDVAPLVPETLAAICLKLTQPSKDVRYQTARELIDDLKRFLESRKPLGPPAEKQTGTIVPLK